jgi:ABC-type uncharacterized transport system auxiliary subunit
MIDFFPDGPYSVDIARFDEGSTTDYTVIGRLDLFARALYIEVPRQSIEIPAALIGDRDAVKAWAIITLEKIGAR